MANWKITRISYFPIEVGISRGFEVAVEVFCFFQCLLWWLVRCGCLNLVGFVDKSQAMLLDAPGLTVFLGAVANKLGLSLSGCVLLPGFTMCY